MKLTIDVEKKIAEHVLFQMKFRVFRGVGKEKKCFVLQIDQLLVCFTYQIYKIEIIKKNIKSCNKLAININLFTSMPWKYQFWYHVNQLKLEPTMPLKILIKNLTCAIILTRSGFKLSSLLPE